MKHEQHNSAAFAPSLPASLSMRTLLRCITLVSALGVLASCGNEAEFQAEARKKVTEEFYSGEAPNPEAQNFMVFFWKPLTDNGRCIQCHTRTGEAPDVPFVDQDNVNIAYAAAIGIDGYSSLVDFENPANSRVVIKVAGGHNCQPSDICAADIQKYINNWVNGPEAAATGGLALMQQLTDNPPAIKSPGASLNFPFVDEVGTNGNSFENTIYRYARNNCVRCHAENGKDQQQSPFFASDDVVSAFAAAKSKIDLDTPENSRFVARLMQGHNCPSPELNSDGDTYCPNDAGDMQLEIEKYALGLVPGTTPSGKISKAMLLGDALLANGGSRYENDQIAIWKFTQGNGFRSAIDTSSNAEGDQPMELTLSDKVEWVLGYGLDFSNGGNAQATTATSAKLTRLIRSTGSNSFSIEAWVIPGNVTQENARIISYSGDNSNRNFAISQTLYNYEFLNNTTITNTEGRQSLITDNGRQFLQSALQHVVFTFDPLNGRRIYVNGVYTGDTDPAFDAETNSFGSLLDWENTEYPFTLGSEADGRNQWLGKIRMVAIHKRALTQEQIDQNFKIGVGQKYLMLFSLDALLSAEGITLPNSYVLFNVEQFDNYAYSFTQPTFVNLDENYDAPSNIKIQGMRIGVNGREAASGQVFGNIDVTINAKDYDYLEAGQSLSKLGTVIAVEKNNNGTSQDEFYLTFEQIGGGLNLHTDAIPSDPVFPVDDSANTVSTIGVRTFDEINATMSAVTKIPSNDTTEVVIKGKASKSVATIFASYKQQFPAVEDIKTFLASHQMAVVQLAFSYCNVLVEKDINEPSINAQFFANFDFTQNASIAFDSQVELDQLINPLLEGLMNANPANSLSKQPDVDEIKELIGSQEVEPSATQPEIVDHNGKIFKYDGLINIMQQCYNPDAGLPADKQCADDATRTVSIAKAVCAATLGSALVLVQ